ncbi:hypothetical protein AB0E69_29290 [Kribbella sp. NPDC026611]|uniref:hypothetical protein n=1 Tax=Kribbella sp. NPDC026611 TaxID=3154911 RepID=UPI0033D6652C
MRQVERSFGWDEELARRGFVTFRPLPVSLVGLLSPLAYVSFGATVIDRVPHAYIWGVWAGVGTLTAVTLVPAVRQVARLVTGSSDLIVTPAGVGLGEDTLGWHEVSTVVSQRSPIVTIRPHPGLNKNPITFHYLGSTHLASWLNHHLEMSRRPGA